jgi:hypothetical protein
VGRSRRHQPRGIPQELTVYGVNVIGDGDRRGLPGTERESAVMDASLWPGDHPIDGTATTDLGKVPNQNCGRPVRRVGVDLQTRCTAE